MNKTYILLLFAFYVSLLAAQEATIPRNFQEIKQNTRRKETAWCIREKTLRKINQNVRQTETAW